MPEVLGTRISSKLYLWMLDLLESTTAAPEAANDVNG